MALKDDVSDLGATLEDIASRANDVVLDQGLGELLSEIGTAAVAANELAATIPSPEQAKENEALTHEKLVRALQRIVDYDEHFGSGPADDDMRAIARRALQEAHALDTIDTEDDPHAYGWSPVDNWSLPIGSDICRADREGRPMVVGDRVQVYGSDRYGNPTGVVRGPGPDRGDGKLRVHVELDNGRDAEYTPSVGRVEVTEPAAPTNGINGINVKPGRTILLQFHAHGIAITEQA